MIDGILANCTVSDLDRAEGWYSGLLERGPDARPMPGLIEWHINDSCGLQLWSDPERAGASGVVFRETDIDGAAERATSLGIRHDGLQPGGGARILQLTDPDGNLVVFYGD